MVYILHISHKVSQFIAKTEVPYLQRQKYCTYIAYITSSYQHCATNTHCNCEYIIVIMYVQLQGRFHHIFLELTSSAGEELV